MSRGLGDVYKRQTITSAVMLGTVFLPTDLIGFAMIIVMMFLTV